LVPFIFEKLSHPVASGRDSSLPVAFRRTLAVALALVAAACGQHAAPAPAPTRILITNAQVIDGTGSAARAASVRISGDRIVGVGVLRPEPGDTVVDARGLVLAPGFIDTHSHHDGGLLQNRQVVAAVSQGVTTIVVGQDGGSNYPLAVWFDSLEKTPPALNVASYAGHGTIRHEVMKDDYKRPARPEEIEKMKALLQQEMAAGALGLSSGLEYDPGIYSKTEELIELAKVSAANGGRYISHMRSEDRTYWSSLHEFLTIGFEAKLPVQLSHTKLAMRSLWGQAPRLIATLDSARAAGVDVTADVYPYTYWSSDLTVMFPARNFEDTAAAEFALKEVAAPDGLLLSAFKPNPSYVGKTLAQIAAERGTAPAPTLLALIHESETYATARNMAVDDGGIQGVIGTSMAEEDVRRIMQWKWADFCSDGASMDRHPRGIGTFPRILGRYVREEHLMPLEEAIRKATSLAATNVGIKERGTIAPGRYADLVLFDPTTVIDRSTPTDPFRQSVGIGVVWVNGVVAFDGGKSTGKTPGRVLRR